MAAVEQNPAAQRIPRSRSARLADQAATAALYVTHPERSFSLRQPIAQPDPATAGSRPGYSHASAMAALAHARKREVGAKQAAAAMLATSRRKTESTSHEGYPYRAAMVAVKEQRALETRGKRRRAESAPSEAARAGALARLEGSGDPFDDLDKYMSASRIQNAHMNPKLFTATPPVALELEEHKRKSIMEAASISMTRDVLGTAQSRESGAAGLQGHPTRAGSQWPASKPEPALQQASSMVLRRAFNLHDVAQKRAEERLASLEDETADYRNYYGVESQNNRSSFSIRRRRGSEDTEQVDMERSKEIRTQMTALRFKLNAVDERREKDRASLHELAKKNVEAAIQDMDKRYYTGDQTIATSKYLDEKAQERAQKGAQDTYMQRLMGDKVNIGGHKYVAMADIEELARSRLQPTFDEIEDHAQTLRARELEARLDEEQRQYLSQIEREREASIEREQRQHQELLKQELKSKEEKAWWKRKSRQMRIVEPTASKDTEQSMSQQANESTSAPLETRSQTAEEAQPRPARTEIASRRESKFKSWFSSRLSRHSSASPSGETSERPERTANESARDTSSISSMERVEGAQEMEADNSDFAGGEAPRTNEPETEHEQTSRPVSGVAYASEENSRAAPLRSNPVGAVDLTQEAKNGDKLDGMTPSEYATTQQGSKEIVEQSSSMEQQRQQESSLHELPTSLNERESLRESATEHSLPAPPSIGECSKQRSNTARESRFSEDL